MEDAPHNLVADVMLGGVVLLGAALIAVLVFRRLGLGAVLGYLVAGIAIGPDGLGLIDAPETILAYSEIGIILLLFLVGLELSPIRLWLLRRDILLFGPLQVTLCGLGMFAIHRAGAAFAAIARPHENRLWRKKLFHPVVSGHFDCPIADDCRRIVTCAGR